MLVPLIRLQIRQCFQRNLAEIILEETMKIKENEIGAQLQWFAKGVIKALGSSSYKIISDILLGQGGPVQWATG